MAKKRTKQAKLPGHENVYIDELDDAARIYHGAKTDRMEMTKAEDEAKDSCIDKMKSHRLSIYESVDGIVLTVTDKSNLRSKRKGEVEENGQGE